MSVVNLADFRGQKEALSEPQGSFLLSPSPDFYDQSIRFYESNLNIFPEQSGLVLNGTVSADGSLVAYSSFASRNRVQLVFDACQEPAYTWQIQTEGLDITHRAELGLPKKDEEGIYQLTVTPNNLIATHIIARSDWVVERLASPEAEEIMEVVCILINSAPSKHMIALAKTKSEAAWCEVQRFNGDPTIAMTSAQSDTHSRRVTDPNKIQQLKNGRMQQALSSGLLAHNAVRP
jgi:hypothetical protein